MKTRRTTQMIAVAFAAMALLLQVSPQAIAAPNIIFILVDDLRWDDLGCTGNPFVQSPNIDRLSREGAQFRNAFAATPLCSPSRGTILTGQFAHVHGITDNTERGKQSHGLRTFPQVLQKAGYETAYIGKWHMGNDNTRRPGFDRWFCLKGHGTSFDPLVNDDDRDVKRTGYVTDVLNEEALEFVNRKHDKPYFLYLSQKAIHPETYQGPDGKLSDPTLSNFIPAPRHRELYKDAKIPRRKNYAVTPTDKPALMQKLEGVPPLSPETASSDKSILNRLRMLAAVDEGVGQLLQALEKNGQLDNTLIAVSGDHGYFYGEHCLTVERRLAYEESIRIPLIMRYPALIPAGTAPEPLVQTTDLAPTFVAIGGGEAQPQYQGRSLVPLLKGEKPTNWRKSVFVEYFSDTVFPRVHKLGYQAVRTDRWKYIHYTDQPGMDELYNLANDEYELQNLISDPDSALSLKTMKALLDCAVKNTAAK